jgi:ankyrin repeat protein
LHWAALNGPKDLAELLLAHGADVNAQDITGATPFHAAMAWGHEEAAELLRQHGGRE